MVEQIDVYDAKTHFSRLIEHVEHGEEIVIGRREGQSRVWCQIAASADHARPEAGKAV